MKINKSLVSKWNSDRENILKYKVNNMGSSRVPCRVRRNVTVSTPGGKNRKCPLAEAQVFEDYKLKSNKGGRVKKLWFETRMKKLCD